ncbi:MAG: hypothetical protein ACRD18_13485 [Terriglobia bacterium]
MLRSKRFIMNVQLVERIANAVLYEGYILYPYRASSVKNRKRFNFGLVYPKAYSETRGGADAADAWCMQTECLVHGSLVSELDVKVRFLHLVERVAAELVEPALELPEAGEPEFRIVEVIEVNGRIYSTWQEAVERDVTTLNCSLREIAAQPLRREFSFSAQKDVEPLRGADGRVVGLMIRNRYCIAGVVEVSAARAGGELFKVRVRILNLTPEAETESRDTALAQSLVSAHTILGVSGGEFVSLLDPPEVFKPMAEGCQNFGTYPVLVGAEGQQDAMLSSPIILYDYPEIAPESAGDFFDGTEIDEMLALRVMTMTDDEKCEMRLVDEHARRILERTESLPPEHLMRLHGVLRHLHPVRKDAL